MISYGKEVDIDKFNYWKIVDIMNNVLRPLDTLKKRRMKLNNKLSMPALLYGSEKWTIIARDTRRITAAEMNYMRKTAGCLWTDYKTDTQTAKELNITPVLNKIQGYRRNWLQHINRTHHNRSPMIKKIQTNGQQKEPGETITEMSGCVSQEWVNKWPNSMLAR